jgi:hypothetical protein
MDPEFQSILGEFYPQIRYRIISTICQTLLYGHLSDFPMWSVLITDPLPIPGIYLCLIPITVQLMV